MNKLWEELQQHGRRTAPNLKMTNTAHVLVTSHWLIKRLVLIKKKSFASFCQGVVKKPSCKLNGRTYSGSFWKLLNLRNDTSFSFVSLSPRKIKIKMLRIEINVVYVQYMQVIMYNQKWRYKICKRTSPNSFLKLCKR